jgi:hypothetical protein
LVWGLMIFNLDRYIVSSMRKEGTGLDQLKTATPRIVLAVLISLVIAKPLEMKIFEKEIQSELTIMEQQVRSQQESEVKLRFEPEKEKLKNDITQLKKEMADKAAHRNELAKQAQEEADGTGGTKRRNAGPIYKIKKADADRVNRELDDLVSKNSILINANLQRIAQLDSIQMTELNSLVRQKLDGPASRMEALSRLTEKSNAIWWANIFIVLLFIVVETAPVIVKLLSSQGPYDNLLRIDEHGFETQRIEEIAKRNSDIKTRGESLLPVEKEFIKEKLDTGLNI